MPRGIFKGLEEVCQLFVEGQKVEQKKKLELADLLDEAAHAVRTERNNYIAELGSAEHKKDLFSLEKKLIKNAGQLRGEVQKVMKFPLAGTQDKKLQEMETAIMGAMQKLESGIQCFRLAEFDVVDEFREVAAKAADELATLIRRTR